MRLFSKSLAILVACQLLGTSLAQAYISLWDFNDPLNRFGSVAGSTGNLSVQDVNFGLVEFRNFIPGSSVNLPSGITPGEALNYANFGSVLNAQVMELSDLDLRGHGDIQLRFAFSAFGLDPLIEPDLSYLRVEYDNGSGNYELLTSRLLIDLPVWELMTFRFNDLLNDKENARIKVTTVGFFQDANFVSYDNVEVVPEPSTALLLMIAGGALLLLRRRQLG